MSFDCGCLDCSDFLEKPIYRFDQVVHRLELLRLHVAQELGQVPQLLHFQGAFEPLMRAIW
jgi:hypothetical protein